jgi:hypothetical protein
MSVPFTITISFHLLPVIDTPIILCHFLPVFTSDLLQDEGVSIRFITLGILLNQKPSNMLKKLIIIILTVFSLTVLGLVPATSDETIPACTRLDKKASGDKVKYSLDADVDGLVFFSDISCAVSYRNQELCAMEMISFDTSAKVYDYYTAEKIDIGKAYFWVDEKDKLAPILAFKSKESAEKYGAAKGAGVILDYTGLTDRMLN